MGDRRQSLKYTNYSLDSCCQCRTGKLILRSGQNRMRCEAVYMLCLENGVLRFRSQLGYSYSATGPYLDESKALDH